MGAVQFILGRSGTGKTRRCIDGICEALQTPSPLRGTDPSQGESPLVLLVPEQATYQAERAILSHTEIAGFSRLHVLSFNRLGFWLQAGTRPEAAELTRSGKQMVLHKLLLEMSDELTLYKGQAQRTGLADTLSDLLTDFQHSNCTAKQVALLADTLSGRQGQELAAAKWADIAVIFQAYEAFFEGPNSFANPDSELSQVKHKVSSALFLKGMRLWVDGFSGFSVQERELLIELLKVSKEASIALCLDPAAMDLENDDEDKLDPCSLFASTEQTYCQLLRIVRGCKFERKCPILLSEPLRFSEAPALALLEANLITNDLPKTTAGKGAIQIAACGDVRAETQWVAGKIRTLVKDRGYRYRDIAVVVPDMDAYQHYIESAFAEYALPYFLDRPRLMKVHPLTELIGSALQVVAGDFGLSDVLSFLKSPLGQIDFEQIDALENYSRAFDVQGAEWLQEQAWTFASGEEQTHYDEPALDNLRRQAVRPLHDLQKALTRRPAITVADFTRAVWDLLDTLEVPKVLAEWAKADVTDQQFGHRQLFGKMVALMDEMCVIFEGVELDAGAWGSIFTEALSSMTVKLIPPTLDQVLVGSIERSRHPDIKAVFLIGATQKQFPVPVVGETLLTEQDYQFAADMRLELTNPYDVSLTHRPYLAYIALTRASKQVFLSYPVLDEKGSAVVPWSGIEQLTVMFSDVEIQYPPVAPEKPEGIENPHQLARWLCSKLGKDRLSDSRQQAAGNNEHVAAGVLQRMADSDDLLRQTAEHVKMSLAYDNTAKLDSKLAKELFIFPMTTSVTRLGMFARCPYQYFARYTLGLERRQVLRFEPMDVGLFYHEVLEAIFVALKKQGRDWAELKDEELLSLCDAECDKVLASNTQLVNFMRRRVHHRYIIHTAKDTIRAFVPMLAQLSRVSRFKQTEAELAFGPKERLRLIVPLDDKRKIEFKGFIDRLDTADIDGKTAAVVFDYKKGGKSVDFAGMLYGLDLQLPVYLLAVRNAGPGDVPAGAFFLPIDTGMSSASLSDLNAIESSFNKAKGLFDGDFFNAIDTEAAPSNWSGYYNFYVNKEGDPYSHYNKSGALRPADFQVLLDYTEQCIRKLIDDLAAGCISITPYRIGTTSPCTWCDYRPVCRFDWQINEYNILDNVAKEEALKQMKDKI